MSLRKPGFPALLPLLGATLVIGFCGLVQPARTQPAQQDSVVEAARRAHEGKKDAKAGKIYTNEDITQLKGDVSVVGPSPAAAAPAATDKNAGTANAAGSEDQTPKDEASWRKKFADARKTLADDSKELDILQREFNLKQQQFYSDPNVALREQNSRKDLDDTQAKIDAKKADVEKDGQAISDLQEALRKSGGDPGWATAPPSDSAGSTAP